MEKNMNRESFLGKAKWIWPGGEVYIYNLYAQFRKDFVMEKLPRNAQFLITADQFYKLYVNGQYVCRGPARGYQEHWPYDEIDLMPYLKTGHNWISVLAYNPGTGSFQYVHRNVAGFICAGKFGNTIILSDSDWKMCRRRGVKVMTAKYSRQIAFQEHFDARESDISWIEEETPELGWENLDENTVMSINCFAYGRPPYDRLETRGIPMLREDLIAPAGMTCSAKGKCGGGWRQWDNITYGWNDEAVLVKNWQGEQKTSIYFAENALQFSADATGKERYHAYTFDAGEYLCGNIVIEALEAEGGEVLDFQHHENIVNGRPELRPVRDFGRIAMSNRITLCKGRTFHEFYHLLGFRYFTVVVRNSSKPIQIRIKIRKAGYPFSMRGRFESSDKILDGIHEICRRTQQLCSLDAYVDTPWREQAQWWGDARVQAKNTFYLDGDSRLLKRGISSIGGQTASCGLTYGHAPTIAYNCILPDFSLTWILSIWDYYWQTGDISVFIEQLGGIKRILSYFDSKEARSDLGLLRHDRRFWYFGDWAPLYKGEIPALLNLWYLLTLRRLSELYLLAGMQAEGAGCKLKADKLEKLIIRWFFIREESCLCAGLDEKFQKTKDRSVHDQVVLLMLGIMPKFHNSIIRNFVRPYLVSEKLECPTPSAFWCTYLIEEAAKRGLEAETIGFIKDKWSPMLSTGTTWENFEWIESSNGSASHAWSAHPSFHLVNILGGVRQTAPAWAQVEIRPFFDERISHVRVLIPSPKGDIATEWERCGDGIHVKIRIPAKVNARLSMPGCMKAISGKKSFEFIVKD